MGYLFSFKSFLETVSQSITPTFTGWFGHSHVTHTVCLLKMTVTVAGTCLYNSINTITSAVLSCIKIDFIHVRINGIIVKLHTNIHYINTDLEYGVVLPGVLGVVAFQYTAANSGA